MIKGIDVSRHQGVLNFQDIKNNFEFIIIKSTEGNGYVDPKFQANQVGLRATGICLGYYHFARPDLGNTPVAEADWFLKTLGPIKQGEMLVLDYEPAWGGDAVNWCKGFLDRVFSVTKCRPLIYLNQSQVKNFNWKPIIDGNYGLWLAVYDYDPNKPCPPTPWPMVAIKQYSNKLPYGSLVVDGNVFYGDTNNFKSYGYQVNNSNDTDMTEQEKLMLEYIRLNKITEGQLRQGYGYITDNIEEKISRLEKEVETLTQKVKELADLSLVEGKDASYWHLEYVSAKAELETCQKKSLQGSTFDDIVAEIVNRLKKLWT